MAKRLEVRALPVGQGTCNLVLVWDGVGEVPPEYEALVFLGIFDCGNSPQTDEKNMKEEIIKKLRDYMFKRAEIVQDIDAFIDILVVSHGDLDHLSFIKNLLGSFISTGKKAKTVNQTVGNNSCSYSISKEDFYKKAIVAMNSNTKWRLNFVQNKNWVKAYSSSITRKISIEYTIYDGCSLDFQLLTNCIAGERIKAFILKVEDKKNIDMYFAYPDHVADVDFLDCYYLNPEFCAENNGDNIIDIIALDFLSIKKLLHDELFDIALRYVQTIVVQYCLSLSQKVDGEWERILEGINNFFEELFTLPIMSLKTFDEIKSCVNDPNAQASAPKLHIKQVVWGGQYNFFKIKQYTNATKINSATRNAINMIPQFNQHIIDPNFDQLILDINQKSCVYQPEPDEKSLLRFHFCNYDPVYFGHIAKGEKLVPLVSPENASSVITQVVDGNRLLAVLPGDATTQSMEWVSKNQTEVMNGIDISTGRALVLTAPHHGSVITTLDLISKTENGTKIEKGKEKTIYEYEYGADSLNDFLNIFQPLNIVISAGYANRHGHPNFKTVKAYIDWLNENMPVEVAAHNIVYNLKDTSDAEYESDDTEVGVYTLLTNENNTREFKEYIIDSDGYYQFNAFYKGDCFSKKKADITPKVPYKSLEEDIPTAFIRARQL